MSSTQIHSGKSLDSAERNFVVLDESTSVADAAKEMRKRGVMSVLVSSRKNCVGIVTEKDILYRVVAENRGQFKTVLRTIMSTPVITIDAQAPVEEAVKLMRSRLIRRLPVMQKGRVVGLLTLRSVVGNSLDQTVDLAELELPLQQASPSTKCPYCESSFASKDEMSRHIDRLHLGRQFAKVVMDQGQSVKP